MQTVQQQVALANMQELLVKVSQIKIDRIKLMLTIDQFAITTLGDRQML